MKKLIPSGAVTPSPSSQPSHFSPSTAHQIHRWLRTLAGVIALLVILLSSSWAVAPTEEAVQKWTADGVLDEKLASWRAFLASGGCSPSAHPLVDKAKFAQKLALNANAVDTEQVLVLMVQFTDKPFTTPAGGIKNAFDSTLFSDKTLGGRVNPTGSMIDYYSEVSYGKLKLHGNIFGPYTASQPYTYYVGTDDGFSHAGELVRELLTLGNNDINYAQFAVNGRVPSVVIIHAGAGAEEGAYGIWSHMSGVGSLTLDGVSFEDYTINPELAGGGLSAIGVFCHEFGHILGLPDLYDTQYNPGSNGVGGWSLMASGNYNGGSRQPAHPDAWCKIQLGWLDATAVQIVGANITNADIPAVEYNQKVYKIPDSTWVVAGNRYFSKEYFLVENRQLKGSDAALPGAGLLIYHIDDGVYSNTNPARYHVAVEQADGYNGLAYGGSRGDNGDPWPGSFNKHTFDNLSVPNSKLNVGTATTEVGVWNISNSDSVMYANLDYNFSHPYLQLSGTDSLQMLDTAAGNTFDSIIEPGELVTFYCKLKNAERPAYNWTVSLACDDPDVQFIQNNVAQAPLSYLTPAAGVKKSDAAVTFQLAPGAKGSYATFTLTIRADSISGGGDRTFTSSFQFRKMLGTPRLLIVDDDNGQNWEAAYAQVAQRIGVPFRIWSKAGGSPTGAALAQYKYVIWEQGALPTGSFTANDIVALKQYLDQHGNLMLASATAPTQLQALDSTFLHTYLHAQPNSSAEVLYFFGLAGNPVADGAKYKFGDSTPVDMYTVQTLTTTNGGQAAVYASNRVTGITNLGTCGITYNGSYKTAFFTFPMEFLSNTDFGGGFYPQDSLVSRTISFFDAPPFTGAQVVTLSARQQNPARLLTHTPTFYWQVSDTVPYPQQTVEIAAGTDSLWDNAELWSPAPYSTSDTEIAYTGTALVDGQTFYVRVRTSDGSNWTGWKQRQFHVNSAPSVPALSSPASEEVVGNHPQLTVTPSTDAENDVVSYDFEVYSDSTLSTLEQSAAGVTTSSWQVQGVLAENKHNWWRARSYDGADHSAWSASSVFWENAIPEAPTAPCPITPVLADGVPVYSMRPTFRWHLSTDPDPQDVVKYKVEVSTDASFSSSIRADSLQDTTVVMNDSLTFGTHYWWRVIAHDKASLQGTCSQPGEFWTWRLGDLDNSHMTDLSDLSRLVSYLTGGGGTFTPRMLGDLNSDCIVDLADLSRLVNYLTGGGATLMPGCAPSVAPGIPSLTVPRNVEPKKSNGAVRIGLQPAG